MGTKSKCLSGLNFIGTAVFEYDTPKIVHIKNKKVGFLNRFVQLAIVLYIIVWGIIIQKGYQMTGPVTGTITTKLKGASLYDGRYGDYTQNCDNLDNQGNQTFDVGDYVIPPQEPNSFFVMTNLWHTCDQTQRTCAEAKSVYKSSCNPEDEVHFECLNPRDNSTGYVLEGGNGPTTGGCINMSDGTGQCEIRGWCEVENENDTITAAGPKINASEFTVLIKVSIEFPTVQKGLRKRNVLKSANSTYLKSCRFDEKEHLYCPIFTLGKIVDMIQPARGVKKKENFTELSIRGGVVGLEITWDCDHLEWNLDKCHPKYVAKRYDDPNAQISQGYNFRFARYYYDENGVQWRTFTKAYGILFKVELHGTGGKFDFFTLILKIGSMIALLGLAAVVSDVLVLYVLKRRNYYRENKYLNVNDPSADYEIIDGKAAQEMPAEHGHESIQNS